MCVCVRGCVACGACVRASLTNEILNIICCFIYVYVNESLLITGDVCREVSGGQRACYKLVRAEVTWEQARSYCQNLVRGADLVSIESEQEQLFLADAILGNSS